MAFWAKIYQFFNVFSAELMYLTVLKADKNQKYKFSTKTFNIYVPKCPNLSKLSPYGLDLKMYHSLRNK
jgi:hypothetical protein